MAKSSLGEMLTDDEVVTSEFEFEEVGESINLLTVRAGVPIKHAVWTSHCIDDAIKRVIQRVATGEIESIDLSLAYIMGFAARFSEALRAAAGVEK